MNPPMNWWERLVSPFQRHGNDGLTKSERRAYARSYREHEGKKPTPEEMKMLREFARRQRAGEGQ